MAKAKKEPGEAAALEDELSCPICLYLYRNPVCLSCGHSFCKQCIQEVLGAQKQSQALYSCPVCQQQLGPVLELQKNFHLCNIVEAFLATTSKGQEGKGSAEGKEAFPSKGQQGKGSAEGKEVVLCDLCLDCSQPAEKTCLTCDASLCQAHLNKHNSKASQKDHILVEVGTGGVAGKCRCPEHGKLLELYCQDEGQCICMLCSIAPCHKGHSIITLKEAHNQHLAKLLNTVTRLQEHKSSLAATLEKLQQCENQLQTNTRTVTSQVQKLIDEMKTEIIQKEKKILSDIQSSQKKKLAQITEVKKEIEQRRDEAAQHLQSLQKMRDQPDSFLFMKEFQLAMSRIMIEDSEIDRLRASKIKVVAVQLNQDKINESRRLMREHLHEMNSLLEGMLDVFIGQIRWNRWLLSGFFHCPNTDSSR